MTNQQPQQSQQKQNKDTDKKEEWYTAKSSEIE